MVKFSDVSSLNFSLKTKLIEKDEFINELRKEIKTVNFKLSEY